jgi:hypothetical protein
MAQIKRINMNSGFKEETLDSTDKNKRGAQGYVKAATTSWLIGLFSRNVSVFTGQGKTLDLNRGSLIDYINNNLDAEDKALKKSWLCLGLCGGADPTAIQAAFKKVIDQKSSPLATPPMSESQRASTSSDAPPLTPPSYTDSEITQWAEALQEIISDELESLFLENDLQKTASWGIKISADSYQQECYFVNDKAAQAAQKTPFSDWTPSGKVLWKTISDREIEEKLKESHPTLYSKMPLEEKDKTEVIQRIMKQIANIEYGYLDF